MTEQNGDAPHNMTRCIHCNGSIDAALPSDADAHRSGTRADPRAPGTDSLFICEVCQRKGLVGTPGTRGKYGQAYRRIKSWHQIDFDDPEVRHSLLNVFTFMHSVEQEQEIAQLDLSTGPLPWIKHPDKLIWTCGLPPNRGTVQVPDGGIRWQSCIESPHELKLYSPFFGTLDAAFGWTEHVLTITVQKDAQAQAPAKPTPAPLLSLATLTPAHRKRLKRYWIDPRALEPTYVTYQPELYLVRAPTTQKAMELSFGEKLYYDQHYPTALQLAQELFLDGKQVDVVAHSGGFCQITSLTTYADAAIAGDQVNQLWERSAIAASWRGQRIKWAVAGLKEVETGYFKVIALCGEPFIRPQDRDSYLAEQAFQLTLIHALDSDGYAAAHPYDTKDLNQDELREYLHALRTMERRLPAAARSESEKWLQAQGYHDLNQYVDPVLRKMRAAQEQRYERAEAERKARQRKSNRSPETRQHEPARPRK